MMNIVIIDGNTLNPGDLSWDRLRDFGAVTIYDQSDPADGLDRIRDADIVLTNKFVMDSKVISQLPRLKCICVTATGYNVVDIDTAITKGIVVCNASGYSTASTAQHTIALLLELTNNCGDYTHSVSQGDWTRADNWTYTRRTALELDGLTMGIVGFGEIGKHVARLAKALGMNVIAHTRSQSSGSIEGVEMVHLEHIYKTADVISLHCPLNKQSHEMINATSLALMKPTTLIINTGRGALINEMDLSSALINYRIAGAGLDVLQDEPPTIDNPLVGLSNCIITPHVAWGSKASRSRLLDITIDNVRSFIEGRPQNRVN